MANSLGQCPTCGHPAAPDAAAGDSCERCGSPIAVSAAAPPDDDLVMATAVPAPDRPPSPRRDMPHPNTPPPPARGLRPPLPLAELEDEQRRPRDDEHGRPRRPRRDNDDEERRPRRRKRRDRPVREEASLDDGRTDYAESETRTLVIGGGAAAVGLGITIFNVTQGGSGPRTGNDAYNAGKTVGLVFGIILLLAGLATVARSLLR